MTRLLVFVFVFVSLLQCGNVFISSAWPVILSLYQSFLLIPIDQNYVVSNWYRPGNVSLHLPYHSTCRLVRRAWVIAWNHLLEILGQKQKRLKLFPLNIVAAFQCLKHLPLPLRKTTNRKRQINILSSLLWKANKSKPHAKLSYLKTLSEKVKNHLTWQGVHKLNHMD